MMSRIVLVARKFAFGCRSFLGVRGLLQGTGAAIEHAQVLKWLRPTTVVDVGANRGQFALIARSVCPKAFIVAIEPLSSPRGRLQRLFKHDLKFRIEAVAVGRDDGAAVMHVTEEDDSSSLLVPSPLQKQLFGTRTAKAEAVPLRRLSNVLKKSDFSERSILKIDVQGYELSVLQGAADSLDAFFAVYVEASFVELYEGQPKAGDVIELLRERRFAFSGAFNQSWDRHRGTLQADLLFLNTRHTMSADSSGLDCEHSDESRRR